MIKGELQALGLGSAEERAYEALLKERSAGVEELALLLELPRDELDAILDRLLKQGLVLPALSDGDLPIPAAPTAAIRTLIHCRQAELHMKSAELERLRMTADRLASRLTAESVTTPGRSIQVVRGRREIGECADMLLASADREVVILDRPPYVREQLGDGTSPPPGLDIERLLDRGVVVRTVLAPEGLATPEQMQLVIGLVERGLQARVASGVPTKLIGVDRRIALLPPSDASDPTECALVVGDALLRNALVPLFEMVWDQATPVSSSGAGLPAAQKELLSLLAVGLKDEAIARRLGVHVHTARRRISRLLELLGAETRFQAGAQATLRGWLDS